MVDDADPARIHTLSDLKRELDLLRRAEGRQEGKHQLSLDDTVKRLREHRREVPRSTLGNYLSGRTLAPQSVFDDILRALGVDTAAQGTWADAWERLDDARREPTSTDEQEPAPVAGQEPAPTAPVPASRRLKWIMTLGTVALLAGGVVTTIIAISTPTPPVNPATPADSPKPGECTYELGYTQVAVRPTPSFNNDLGRQMMTDTGQLVIGSCQPIRGEPGTGGPNDPNCGVGSIPVDTWIQVRSPHQGWVFKPCLTPRS
ncbi:helix-turn-helix domain-containing protein [Saccharopolyspora spinosa]|uniref:HTH cro/C1-type domain-containing protein n=1 Tax=Saccharopolyspora spinosa TaxID=60894 RepID=A0A2N3Y112_SACSN|nr:helix-turn-helix transcriptional regulator [Saccharopolyspora spinosa]PKW16618.1 hypothetical protein A8926_4467 [Saccharopolyspora spinosa]PKW16695.1 hypothetical protein A8926_4560 [Saccharopolyspora spinosa]